MEAVCFTCFEFCASIEVSNSSDNEFWKMLSFCIPEMVSDNEANRSVCQACRIQIAEFYQFKKRFLDTQRKLIIIKQSASPTKTTANKRPKIVSATGKVIVKKKRIIPQKHKTPNVKILKNERISPSPQKNSDAMNRGTPTKLDHKTESSETNTSATVSKIKTNYECKKCNESFKLQIGLKKHEEFCTKDLKSLNDATIFEDIIEYSCPADNYKTTSPYRFLRHLNTHINVDEEMLNNLEEECLNYMVTENGGQLTLCMVCDKDFKNVRGRYIHAQKVQHTVEKISCRYCNEIIPSETITKLKEHILWEHYKPDQMSKNGENKGVCNGAKNNRDGNETLDVEF